LPFEDNSMDYVISSSCFEHSEFFWLNFLEIMRVLKPSGLFYLNSPSNGDFHRFPVDCWRFYPDSGNAMANWGKRSGYNCELVECYTGEVETDIWADYVAVFIKDVTQIGKYTNRIIDVFSNYTNGSAFPHNQILNSKKWGD
jgi:SAM-dependent methyltransferase